MNSYKDYIKTLEDNAYLISMVPVEELLRFGYEIGLNQNSKVLDLCCGYGTVLKVYIKNIVSRSEISAKI